MTNLHEALQSFWAGFGLPAYATGRVPETAQMPYITYEPLQGGAFGRTVTPAFVWCKEQNGVDLMATVSAYMDTVGAAIRNGVNLAFTGGHAVLYPNSADFLSYYPVPGDRDVLAGRISVEIHFYCE